MNDTAAEPLSRFRAVLADRLGLAFEETRVPQLAEVLSARAARGGGTVSDYLDRLEGDPRAEELAAVAPLVTVGETYFFRHSQQFEALRQVLAGWRATYSPRVLSAGCASGEEAYSLAIVLRERWPRRDPRVVAADVSSAALERAHHGRYSAWSLREVPPAIIARWFKPSGSQLRLDETICRSVRFVRANLALDQPELLAPAAYDIIFCRNMLMYFTPDQFRAAAARLARALVPGGHLFLGSAETLRGVSHDFHLCHAHGAFYYQRRPAGEPCTGVEAHGSVIGAAGADDAWVDEIARAGARILSLAREPRAPAGGDRVAARPRPALGAAFELLHREQYRQALAEVRALPPELSADPEARLLEAVLLVASGDLAGAESAGGQLLVLDELNAGAHYVLALCKAGRGRDDEAAHHDRVAMYLDPAFAMPRLHLGLLLRRQGDLAGACVELGHARSLIEREDAARLLLFGGGFSRGALLALCRAELAKAEPRS